MREQTYATRYSAHGSPLFDFACQNADLLSGVLTRMRIRETTAKLYMEALEENKISRLVNIDKSDWGEGPWKDEIDYYAWEDAFTDYECVIRRDLHATGAWLGYVKVPSTHLLFREPFNSDGTQFLFVHGGLTYSSHGEEPLLPFDEEGWWFGFDCAHAGDLLPLSSFIPDQLGDLGTYKDINFVKKECEKLASQLKEMAED